MNCFDIIKNHLIVDNYDGLFNREGECACVTDDLEPCDGLCIDLCQPGYVQVEERDDSFIIGEYHPKLCPKCKTKRDVNQKGFKLACPECGHRQGEK